MVVKALSYGKAVLVSDIPENLEAVQAHGFAFRNRDFSDLGANLEILLKRPNLVRVDEERRKRYVQNNFSWDRAAEGLESLFARCLNGKSGAGTCMAWSPPSDSSSPRVF
jgi:glycosyltransferase involved in cell wall biosynthesis